MHLRGETSCGHGQSDEQSTAAVRQRHEPLMPLRSRNSRCNVHIWHELSCAVMPTEPVDVMGMK